MATTTQAPAQPTWVRHKIALATIGGNSGMLSRLVDEGKVRCRAIPGARRWYALEDLEELSRQYTTGGK